MLRTPQNVPLPHDPARPCCPKGGFGLVSVKLFHGDYFPHQIENLDVQFWIFSCMLPSSLWRMISLHVPFDVESVFVKPVWNSETPRHLKPDDDRWQKFSLLWMMMGLTITFNTALEISDAPLHQFCSFFQPASEALVSFRFRHWKSAWTESEAKVILVSENDLFLTLGSGTSIARNETPRPLQSTNITQLVENMASQSTYDH